MDIHRFCENYLVLRPEDVSFLDLFCLLLNLDIDRTKFADFPDGKGEYLQPRWRIFISLFAQKILQILSKPMSWFGSVLEMWLNLLSSNHGIFMLVLNFLRGKVVMPVRGTENFVSAIGHLDERVHLDQKIKPNNSRYQSALAVMAAKLSYENKAFVKRIVTNYWKMELPLCDDFWNDYERKRTTTAFMLHDKTSDPDIVVVAFRGTEPFDADDWCTDVDVSWYELPGIGKIHDGFMKALGLLMFKGWPKEIDQEDCRPIAYYTIREKLREILGKNAKTKFIVTGHSLGGALAILFPAVLAMHGETLLLQRLEGVYTFGQPRVGDEEFKKFMDNQIQKYGFKYLRFVYSNDVIPRLPTDDSKFFFKHFGTCLYFNSCYCGKILPEEPEKNHISIFADIPRFLNAVRELKRSFILPLAEGPDYKEGWLLILARLFGLVIPGLIAHAPQDYVNITRLGSESIFWRAENPGFSSISKLVARKID